MGRRTGTQARRQACIQPAGRHAGRQQQVGKHAGGQAADRQGADKHACRQAGKDAGRQVGRHACKQASKSAGRQQAGKQLVGIFTVFADFPFATFTVVVTSLGDPIIFIIIIILVMR